MIGSRKHDEPRKRHRQSQKMVDLGGVSHPPNPWENKKQKAVRDPGGKADGQEYPQDA